MLLSTALLLSMLVGAATRLVNITIDDQYGDARTGRLVSYGFSGRNDSASWVECSEANSDSLVGVLDGMDWRQVQNGTLHYAHTGGQHSFDIFFQGTALYAFFVLDSRASLAMSWFLENDSYAEAFRHDATTQGEKYIYQTVGLRRENLKPGPHQASITFNAPRVHGNITGNATVMFDYAMYTTEMDDAIPGSNPDSNIAVHRDQPQRRKIAIICVILGCSLLTIIVAPAWFHHQRTNQRRAMAAAGSESIIANLKDELAKLREEHELLKQTVGPPPEYSDGARSEHA